MKSANSSLGVAFRHCCRRLAYTCVRSRGTEQESGWSFDGIVPFYVGDIVFALYPPESELSCLFQWPVPSTVSIQPPINGGTQRVGSLESSWETGRSIIVSIQSHCRCNGELLAQITFLILSLLL